jgi:ferrous iron transport protein A
MMPLGLLFPGEHAEVMELRGTDNACAACRGCLCRLEDLGLRAGKTVEMLKNYGNGALLVRVDNSRLALNRGMAMKIKVRRKD